MNEIKNFLDYSIALLSTDSKIFEKHLTDLKDYVAKPIVSYLTDRSQVIEIGDMPQIIDQELFYDYLKHFDLEFQWKKITDNQRKILSLVQAIESGFKDFSEENEIPTMKEIRKSLLPGGYYGYPDTIEKIPIKDFVERFICFARETDSDLDKRLTIEKYSSQNIIIFRKEPDSPGNVSIIYHGGDEADEIFNLLRKYVMDNKSSKNVSRLNGAREALDKGINQFKVAIKGTLYFHLFPTNIQCPFLTVIR